MSCLTPQSQEILARLQVRKTKKQKEAFRTWLCEELEAAGYAPAVEKGGSSRNVVVGDPEQAELLLTAHYDTQPVLPFPNFITPRNFGVYLLYQLVFVAVFFALAFGSEALVLLLFDPPFEVAAFVPCAVCFFAIWWMMAGKANKHTVNDNTSGVLTLMEIALALPEERRRRACLVFFDNEEKGMLGSQAFAKAHPEVKKSALVLNFDCVSDGDYLQFYPGKRMRGDGALEQLERAFPSRGDKQVEVVRGFGFYPSDNKSFRRGVGICALKKNRVVGYYMDRIHTGRDTVLEEENILLLRDGALRLLEQAEGKLHTPVKEKRIDA